MVITDTWKLVLLFEVLVEAIVEVFEAGLPDNITPPSWLWPVVSSVIGVAMCVMANVDALTALGVEIAVPFIGQVITGLLVSRGSNFLHVIWKRIIKSNDTEDEADGTARRAKR